MVLTGNSHNFVTSGMCIQFQCFNTFVSNFSISFCLWDRFQTSGEDWWNNRKVHKKERKKKEISVSAAHIGGLPNWFNRWKKIWLLPNIISKWCQEREVLECFIHRADEHPQQPTKHLGIEDTVLSQWTYSATTSLRSYTTYKFKSDKNERLERENRGFKVLFEIQKPKQKSAEK